MVSSILAAAVTTQPESSMEVSTAQQAPEEVPTTVEPLTNVEQPTEEPNGMSTISMPDSESHTAHVFMTLCCCLYRCWESGSIVTSDYCATI